MPILGGIAADFLEQMSGAFKEADKQEINSILEETPDMDDFDRLAQRIGSSTRIQVNLPTGYNIHSYMKQLRAELHEWIESDNSLASWEKTTLHTAIGRITVEP